MSMFMETETPQYLSESKNSSQAAKSIRYQESVQHRINRLREKNNAQVSTKMEEDEEMIHFSYYEDEGRSGGRLKNMQTEVCEKGGYIAQTQEPQRSSTETISKKVSFSN